MDAQAQTQAPAPIVSAALQDVLGASDGVTLRIEIADASNVVCGVHTVRPRRTTKGSAVRYLVRLACGTPGRCASGPAARGLVPSSGCITLYVVKLERIVTCVKIPYALPRPALRWPPRWPRWVDPAPAQSGGGGDTAATAAQPPSGTAARTFCALPATTWALAYVPQPGADATEAELDGAWDVYAAATFSCAVECTCSAAGLARRDDDDDNDDDAAADNSAVRGATLGGPSTDDDLLVYSYVESCSDAAYSLQQLEVQLEAAFFAFYLRATERLAAQQ